MSLNDRLQALAERPRFSQSQLDDEDTSTCGNCGESFTDDIQWYDNDRFIYVCLECAEAECAL